MALLLSLLGLNSYCLWTAAFCQDGDSDIVASIYFVIMVSATAFMLLNMALAIVTVEFEERQFIYSPQRGTIDGAIELTFRPLFNTISYRICHFIYYISNIIC